VFGSISNINYYIKYIAYNYYRLESFLRLMRTPKVANLEEVVGEVLLDYVMAREDYAEP
jgi:hypothetical protein